MLNVQIIAARSIKFRFQESKLSNQIIERDVLSHAPHENRYAQK